MCINERSHHYLINMYNIIHSRIDKCSRYLKSFSSEDPIAWPPDSARVPPSTPEGLPSVLRHCFSDYLLTMLPSLTLTPWGACQYWSIILTPYFITPVISKQPSNLILAMIGWEIDCWYWSTIHNSHNRFETVSETEDYFKISKSVWFDLKINSVSRELSEFSYGATLFDWFTFISFIRLILSDHQNHQL